MRALMLAAVASLAMNVAAIADENVAGAWHANLGSGVTINMKISPDGGWNSETLQHNQVVRQMSGTYQQRPSNGETGTLVFVPTKESAKTGAVQTEVDKYELAQDRRQLKLTSGGDTMVFEKQK